MEAALGNIRKQCPHNDEQRGSVQEHNRQVRQAQKPGAQESVIPAESFLRIGINTACHGRAAHEIRKIPSDDQHKGHSQEHGDQRSRRAGNREECRSRHGKHAPAHHAPESNRPDIPRLQIPIQRLYTARSLLIHAPRSFALLHRAHPRAGSDEPMYVTRPAADSAACRRTVHFE